MKWGLTLLAWTLIGLFLANGCLDYVRVWQDPPMGYSQNQVLPHLKACGVTKAKQFGVATAALIVFYYGSGWAATRLRSKRRGPSG
jgi:hypothetical protein